MCRDGFSELFRRLRMFEQLRAVEVSPTQSVLSYSVRGSGLGTGVGKGEIMEGIMVRRQSVARLDAFTGTTNSGKV